jgi:hypothetical protein
MLVLATFLTICIVAVLLLLRFLIALDAEITSARNRSTVKAESIPASRTQRGSQSRNSAPVLNLVHFHSPRPVASGSFVARERNSRYKEA